MRLRIDIFIDPKKHDIRTYNNQNIASDKFVVSTTHPIFVEN